MELIFDTETSGLPLYKEPATHPAQPDIIQFGAVLCDENEVYETISVILDPSDINPGWKMNPFAEAAHGITTEKVLAEGVKTTGVMAQFLELAEKADLLVCHNTSFDQKMVENALHKASFPYEAFMLFTQHTYYCTMKVSTPLCNLKKKNGQIKWPKLDELHQFLFGEAFENAHDALGDVLATRRCYYELKRRGL